jgi:hypothetical protein
MKLRDYQEKAVEDGYKILLSHRMVYLSMQVRTGKTITSLHLANKLIGHLPNETVLFITTKKAIDMGGIQEDYNASGFKFGFEIISMDSIHKANKTPNYYHVVICDESHSIGGSYPKPSNRANELKVLLNRNKYAFQINLSGTPNPESYSQLFHQFWVNPNHEWSKMSFYQWAKEFVDVKKKYVGTGVQVNDYSEANEKEVLKIVGGLFLKATQEDAGFKTSIQENIVYIEEPEILNKIQNKLIDERVVVGKSGTILADTGVKLQNKLHQISSGTVILEEESKAIVLSNYKSEYILQNFKDKRCVIFYLFKAELKALQDTLGSLVSETRETQFIALQIQSGAKAITLKEYDAIIYYNIPFSAELYWQSRDRMSFKERLENQIYFLFSQNGIEQKVYAAVQKKKDFTLKVFYESYPRVENTKQNHTLFGE